GIADILAYGRPRGDRRCPPRGQPSVPGAVRPIAPNRVGRAPPPTCGRRRSRGGEAPQHVREDAAVPDVLALARRVEPQACTEHLLVGTDRDLARLRVVDALDRELLAAGQPERLRAL